MSMVSPVAPMTFALAGTVIAVGGSKIEGFGDGSAIEVEPQGESWQTVVGVDGAVARAATRNTLFKVTLKLLQTSPANAKLSQIFLADNNALSGLVCPFLYKDLAGLDKFTSPFFWVNKMPKLVRGAKIETHDWECMAAQGSLFLGGSLPTPIQF
jgi:hypothetical protein